MTIVSHSLRPCVLSADSTERVHTSASRECTSGNMCGHCGRCVSTVALARFPVVWLPIIPCSEKLFLLGTERRQYCLKSVLYVLGFSWLSGHAILQVYSVSCSCITVLSQFVRKIHASFASRTKVSDGALDEP